MFFSPKKSSVSWCFGITAHRLSSMLRFWPFRNMYRRYGTPFLSTTSQVLGITGKNPATSPRLSSTGTMNRLFSMS